MALGGPPKDEGVIVLGEVVCKVAYLCIGAVLPRAPASHGSNDRTAPFCNAGAVAGHPGVALLSGT